MRGGLVTNTVPYLLEQSNLALGRPKFPLSDRGQSTVRTDHLSFQFKTKNKKVPDLTGRGNSNVLARGSIAVKTRVIHYLPPPCL